MNKNQLMNEVITDMSGVLTQEQLMMLSGTLMKCFSNYDITLNNSSQYALMCIDEFNDMIVKQFLVHISLKGLSEKTIEQYKRHCVNMITTINKRVTDITTNDLEMYLVSYKYTRKISNTTLRNTKNYISVLFDFLEEKDYIKKNPCSKLTRIKEDTILEDAFSKTEEEKLYTSCNNLRDRALLEVLFSTGCRVSEVCGMKIDDVNFDKKTITVIGKGNKKRTVCISDKAIYHLKRYLKIREDNKVYLFVSLRKNYKNLNASGVEAILIRLGKKAGVNNVHPHRMRATFATHLIDSGMDLHQVQKLMGHESIETTLRYYRGTYNVANSYNKLVNNM